MSRSIRNLACQAAGAVGVRRQDRDFATDGLAFSTKVCETFCLLGE